MKRSLLMVPAVILILVLLLTGCVKSNPATSAPVSTQTTTASAVKPASVIHWKGQSAYAAGISKERGDNIAKWLERASGGQLVIDLAPPGAIVPVAEMYDAVSKGVLDFAGNYYAGYYMGKFPEQDIEGGLPFAYTNLYESWDFLYNRGAFDIFQKVYAEKNIKWFPCLPDVHYHLGVNFDLNSIHDIKGKKIRASGTMADYMQALGASPVNLPPGDMYMASKLGTIDGVTFSIEGLEDYKLKEVWKSYVIEPNATALITNYLINMDSWNKLPKSLQDTIQREMRHVDLEATMSGGVWIRSVERAATKDYNVKMVSLPQSERDEIMKIAVSIWDKTAAKSPRNAQLIDIVKAMAKANGKIQ